jgi:hypothetical protein
MREGERECGRVQEGTDGMMVVGGGLINGGIGMWSVGGY